MMCPCGASKDNCLLGCHDVMWKMGRTFQAFAVRDCRAEDGMLLGSCTM